jgi:hypothetical protein
VTTVNAVAAAGLVVERLVEGDCDEVLTREQDRDPEKWYSVARARLMPPSSSSRRAGRPRPRRRAVPLRRATGRRVEAAAAAVYLAHFLLRHAGALA